MEITWKWLVLYANLKLSSCFYVLHPRFYPYLFYTRHYFVQNCVSHLAIRKIILWIFLNHQVPHQNAVKQANTRIRLIYLILLRSIAHPPTPPPQKKEKQKKERKSGDIGQDSNCSRHPVNQLLIAISINVMFAFFFYFVFFLKKTVHLLE